MATNQTPSKEIVISQLAIIDAIAKTSEEILRRLIPNVKIVEINKPIDASSDHWISSVLLDTAKTQIFFRVHFTTSTSRTLLSKALKSEPGTIDPKLTHDHIKEYCNHVIGVIKGALSLEIDIEQKKKVFLPQVNPSYDMFKRVPTGDELNNEERWWVMSWDDGSMTMYARVKSATGLTPESLKNLANEKVMTVDNSGEIEFL